MPAHELKGQNVPIQVWAPLNEVESQALDQLKNVARLPWVFHHVAAMADLHFGKGCTVGSVIAMKGAVAPAAVGVDIGCGMMAVRSNLGADRLRSKDLKALRNSIEAAIPVGFMGHENAAFEALDDGTKARVVSLLGRFKDLHPKVQELEGRCTKQVGTLGGGNHFIELLLDTEGAVWLMLHSGSRNIGKSLAELHIRKAQELAHNQELPDRDLAVFLAKTPEMAAYRHDLYWAQEYAALNRVVMLELYKGILRDRWSSIRFDEPIQCHHNYVAEEVHFGEEVMVTRKGAIRAQAGDMGIIPGSMGTKSYIVRGLGNPQAFNSASHGAGRKMSRGKAKRKFTRRDAEEQTAGVECRKDKGILDELPGAYKNIERVMEHQKDLVEVVAELKQVLCVKG